MIFFDKYWKAQLLTNNIDRIMVVSFVTDKNTRTQHLQNRRLSEDDRTIS